LYTRDATRLKRWIEIRPTNAVTVLDTHDGIGVVDVDAERRLHGAPGLLSPDDIADLVDTIHRRSRGGSRQATGAAANNLDLSQVNCTFYDALGRNDREYLVARASQCFVPGVPQIYYVGLLAGTNDLELLRRSGVGRDINRHYYTAQELQEQLTRPVVRSLLALLRLRNSHPAFNGTFRIESSPTHQLALAWTHGRESVRLDVDLAPMCASVTCVGAAGGTDNECVWQAVEAS
jgi:sucrose phosphorylase